MLQRFGVLLDRPVRLVREGTVGENKQDLPCGWAFEFGTLTPLRGFLAILPDALGPDQIAPFQAARRPARLTLDSLSLSSYRPPVQMPGSDGRRP